jgi:hypothetical protein
MAANVKKVILSGFYRVNKSKYGCLLREYGLLLQSLPISASIEAYFGHALYKIKKFS